MKLTIIQNLHLPKTRLKIVRSSFPSGALSSVANLSIANSFSLYVIHQDLTFEVMGLGMKITPKTNNGREMTKSGRYIVSKTMSDRSRSVLHTNDKQPSPSRQS